MLLAVCVRSYVKTGDRVVVCDLLDGVELNGCSGVVEAWLPDSEATADDGGRWRRCKRDHPRHGGAKEEMLLTLLACG